MPYKANIKRVWELCYVRMLRSSEFMLGSTNAEDVVSEFMLRMQGVVDKKTFNNEEHAKAYTLYYFKRYMIDWLRRRETHCIHMTRYQMLLECADRDHMSHVNPAHIRKCVNVEVEEMSSHGHRELAMLIGGASLDDVCNYRGVSKKTMYRLLKRQLDTLRKERWFTE